MITIEQVLEIRTKLDNAPVPSPTYFYDQYKGHPVEATEQNVAEWLSAWTDSANKFGRVSGPPKNPYTADGWREH